MINRTINNNNINSKINWKIMILKLYNLITINYIIIYNEYTHIHLYLFIYLSNKLVKIYIYIYFF